METFPPDRSLLYQFVGKDNKHRGNPAISK